MSAHTDFTDILGRYQQRVNKALDHWLPSVDDEPNKLHHAIRYSALGGGKRIRPALLYAAGETLGIDLDRLDGPACAVELIHVYSLIHDDLPAMDDDDLRRGRPTVHKAFDEATAILAGDALQAFAFEILTKDPAMQADASTRVAMIRMLAEASGLQGMAGGQAIDLDAVGKTLTLEQLEHMHSLKTGALIRASVKLATLSAEHCDSLMQEHLDQFALQMGLAFQIQDDILDVIGDTVTLGKPQGSDQQLNKPTYPAILGLEGAQARAQELHSKALHNLDIFQEKADMLRQLSAYIVERSH